MKNIGLIFIGFAFGVAMTLMVSSIIGKEKTDLGQVVVQTDVLSDSTFFVGSRLLFESKTTGLLYENEVIEIDPLGRCVKLYGDHSYLWRTKEEIYHMFDVQLLPVK